MSGFLINISLQGAEGHVIDAEFDFKRRVRNLVDHRESTCAEIGIQFNRELAEATARVDIADEDRFVEIIQFLISHRQVAPKTVELMWLAKEAVKHMVGQLAEGHQKEGTLGEFLKLQAKFSAAATELMKGRSVSDGIVFAAHIMRILYREVLNIVVESRGQGDIPQTISTNGIGHLRQAGHSSVPRPEAATAPATTRILTQSELSDALLRNIKDTMLSPDDALQGIVAIGCAALDHVRPADEEITPARLDQEEKVATEAATALVEKCGKDVRTVIMAGLMLLGGMGVVIQKTKVSR